MISGYDPETNICWCFNNKGDRERRCKCPVCSRRHDEKELVFFGRCRSGRRWFWHVGRLATDQCVNGYAATEAEAMAAAMAAVPGFGNGLPIAASVSHGCASDKLKELNKAKRLAKPPSDATGSRIVEYLYSGERGCDDYDARSYLVFYRFRILKRSARRVYYLRKAEWIDAHGEPTGTVSPRGDDEIGFIDRAKLEAKGQLYSSHTWHADWHLFATLENVITYYTRHDSKPIEPSNLAALKAAMAAAHPDRGGSSAAFIEARERYLTARRRANHDAA